MIFQGEFKLSSKGNIIIMENGKAVDLKESIIKLWSKNIKITVEEISPDGETSKSSESS